MARAKAWAAVRARVLAYFASAWAVLLAFAAYVNRQPPGTYTSAQQAARVAPAFLAPAAGWLAHRLLAWLQVGGTAGAEERGEGHASWCATEVALL